MIRTNIVRNKHPVGAVTLACTLAAVVVFFFAVQAIGSSDQPATEPVPMPVVIVSPWDGVFQAGEYPGAPPLVEMGSTVEPNTVVGIIDAMRPLPVKAGVTGTITEVLVTDSEMVEAGQPLFLVRPPLPPI